MSWSGEGEYEFDQYGYQDFDDDEYADDSSRSPDDYGDSPDSPDESGYDFGMSASDYGRVSKDGGGPMVGVNKRYIDPRDKALSDFRSAFKRCSKSTTKLSEAEARIDKLDNLLTLNTTLLAIAACYHAVYRDISIESVTEFITNQRGGEEPIDVIRYIRYYAAA